MTTLIFGATGGVGAALARRLSARGKRLHLAGRDGAKLSALASELGTQGTVCDVLDDDELAAAADAAGPDLSGLAFCVGSIDLAPLRRVERELMRKSVELNAISAAMALKAAEGVLKKNGGSAVLFSSVAVAQGFAQHAAISAAKGAVEGLVRAVAAEWAPKARINAIAPSLMKTGIAEPMTANAAVAEGIAKMHPMARLGEADDAAALADFLLSEDAGWICGEVFAVDGGRGRVRSRG
ncbi:MULTISPECIES: SDR family NAD(P)-dependent oxidoreductase [Hyphobacterium]|uniref:SDR family NAD(P)-dependent oxidoreductase n=1 Tax=Hyphobacterium vulgare TaxID=1736751 RepID=A0ABV6ZTA7_9PROT